MGPSGRPGDVCPSVRQGARQLVVNMIVNGSRLGGQARFRASRREAPKAPAADAPILHRHRGITLFMALNFSFIILRPGKKVGI